jgi:tripartite ATP-independent transporter DctM subunit
MGSSTAAIMLTIAGATLLGFIATAEQMGPKLMHVFLSFSDSTIVILLIVNVALLILGCLMEPVPIILLTVPIFFPALTKIGVDPVHLGVVMTLNLMIGLLHPPLGMVLFVLSRIAKLSIERTTMAILPWLLPLLGSLVAITMIPEITLWLPRMVGLVK